MAKITRIIRSSIASLRTIFVAHPESIGESYFEHQRAALGFAATLAIAAAAAFLHALIPCLCKTTASEKIETLNNRLQRRVPDVHNHGIGDKN